MRILRTINNISLVGYVIHEKAFWKFCGYTQAQLQTLNGTFSARFGIGESATRCDWLGKIGLQIHELFLSFKKFNDRYWVNKNVSDFSIELYLDDERKGSTTISLSSISRIEGMLGSQGGLYVGGVPSGLNVNSMAASLYSLKGCLSDLIVNSKYVLLLFSWPTWS